LQETIDSIRNNTKQVAAASGSDLTASSVYKRILIVDDNTDINFTYKRGLERYYEGYDDNDNNNKIRFEVYTYNNPLVALSEFKPNFQGRIS
jgi:hypothetical protein